MAGAPRGRRDGNLVKITLSNGTPIACPIYRGNTAGLGCCVEGGYIPEELYFLSCHHYLCAECFHARTEYVCKLDKKKTKIQRGVEHSYFFNFGLTKIILECPRCRNPVTYKNIKEHIEVVHPECFGQEAQHPPLKEQVPQHRSPKFVGEDYAAGTQRKYRSRGAASPSSLRRQSEAVPKKEEDEWQQDKAQLGHGGNGSSSHQSQDCGRGSVADIDSDMLTDDESSDTPLRETPKKCGIQGEDSEEIGMCPHCISPLEVSEIQEHKQNCPQRSVVCHVCETLTTVLSYDEHVQSHYEAEERKNKGAQKATDDGQLSGKDAENLVAKFQKGQTEEEPSDPMSPEEIAKYIQSLKTKNKKFNESCQPQTKLLAAIDTPAQGAKKDRKDKRGENTRNAPVEIPATEPTLCSEITITTQPHEIAEDAQNPGINVFQGERGDDPSGKTKKELVETAVTNAKQEDEDDELNRRKEVTALKNRIKELEDRLERLERPLKRLIERLSQEEQRKGSLRKSSDL